MAVYHDWGQYYLGWAYFRDVPWSFPFGQIENFNYPAGTNIGFMDSIPLFAFFFKVFSAILPENFQYFGLYLLFSHLMLSYYSIKVLEYYKVNRLLIVLANVLIVFCPLILYRGMNPGSTSHWLLIASVFNYLRTAKGANVNKINLSQAGLTLIGALINPYFFLMLISFNLIIPLKHFFFDKLISFKKVIAYVIIGIAPSILLWYCIGMISFDHDTSLEVSNSYGLYGANLNTFFNPFYTGVLLPSQENYRPHQYEGFAYLGMGFLLLISLAIASIAYSLVQRKSFGHLLNWNLSKSMLSVLVLLFTLFAITNQVTWGDRLLFEYSVPDEVNKLGSIFRATGRFIWYLYYGLIFLSIIVFSRLQIHRGLKLMILLVVGVVQFYDISPLFGRHHYEVGDYSPERLDDKKWIKLFGNFDKVITYPPFNNSMLYQSDYQDLCFLALEQDIPITTGYVARETTEINERFFKSLKDSLRNGKIEHSSLYLTTKEHLETFAPLVKNHLLAVTYLDGYFLFSSEKQLITEGISSQEDLLMADSIINKIIKESDYTQLKRIDTTSRTVKMNVEFFHFDNNTIRTSGWAFLNTKKDIGNDKVRICLSSDTNSYLFKTKVIRRSDVTAHFEAINLDSAGFKATIYTHQIPPGTYTLSLVIENSNGIIANQVMNREKLEIK